MKKQIVGMILLAACMLCLGSCKEKDRVTELKEFVEKVQEEGSTYTAQQWEEVNDKFSKLLEKLNSYEDLTPEELKELATPQGKYAATVFKNQTDEALEKAGAVLGGFLEGLTNDDADNRDLPDQNEETED